MVLVLNEIEIREKNRHALVAAFVTILKKYRFSKVFERFRALMHLSDVAQFGGHEP